MAYNVGGRFDIIEEFQSVFKSKQDNEYLLWMDFEKAIGEYDIDVAQSWSFQNLYVIECFLCYHGILKENPRFVS